SLKEKEDLAELDLTVADKVPLTSATRATRPPVAVRLFGDQIFNFATFVLAAMILALLIALVAALTYSGWPSMTKFGLKLFVTSDCDPVVRDFGALPFIYGTFVTSLLALAIAVPLSLGVALCLSEMAPDWLSTKLGFMVDLLAAIPSVVYGLWAIFML